MQKNTAILKASLLKIFFDQYFCPHIPQVGYFVGGVASLESGQIAGIAVTFASIALVLLVFLLVFLLRHRHCSSMVLCSSRNNKQTSANGHLQVEKANANGHVIHQTLNVSYLVCISL